MCCESLRELFEMWAVRTANNVGVVAPMCDGLAHR